MASNPAFSDGTKPEQNTSWNHFNYSDFIFLLPAFQNQTVFKSFSVEKLKCAEAWRRSEASSLCRASRSSSVVFLPLGFKIKLSRCFIFLRLLSLTDCTLQTSRSFICRLFFVLSVEEAARDVDVVLTLRARDTKRQIGFNCRWRLTNHIVYDLLCKKLNTHRLRSATRFMYLRSRDLWSTPAHCRLKRKNSKTITSEGCEKKEYPSFWWILYDFFTLKIPN